jgi:broad specificity phosphatase PhoE
VERRYGSIDAAPGVEPMAALAERARAAFVELVAEHDSGPIVLVSHDAFNRALLQHIDPMTFAYNITIGTPIYIELARILG